MPVGDGMHAGDELVHFGLWAIKFDDQDRIDIERIARLYEVLGRTDRRAVHHLKSRRDDAGRDHIRNTGAGAGGRTEADQHCARRLRLRQYAYRHFGDDTQQALGPYHQSQQIQLSRIQIPPAEPQHLALRRDQLDSQDIVRREAVLQAVHPAGVLRDITANGAGDLAGGIRSVVETPGSDRVAERKIRDAALGDNAAIGVVDFENAIEASQADHNRIRGWYGSAGQRSPGTTRDYVHA